MQTSNLQTQTVQGANSAREVETTLGGKGAIHNYANYQCCASSEKGRTGQASPQNNCCIYVCMHQGLKMETKGK